MKSFFLLSVLICQSFSCIVCWNVMGKVEQTFLTYFLCSSLLCISLPRCPFGDLIFQGEPLLISLHADMFLLLLSTSWCGKIKKLWSPYCQSPKRKPLSFSEVSEESSCKELFSPGKFSLLPFSYLTDKRHRRYEMEYLAVSGFPHFQVPYHCSSHPLAR